MKETKYMLSLSENLHKEAKIRAIQEGITLKNLIIKALTEYLIGRQVNIVQVDDLERHDLETKEKRLGLFHNLVEQEFGEYEELPDKGGRTYNIDSEAAVAVNHPSGTPRVVLALTRELLTDEGISFEDRFNQGIKAAKDYLNKGEGTFALFQLLTDQIRLVAERM